MPKVDYALLPEDSAWDLARFAEERRWILSFAKKGGIGAELGVFRGHFSEVIADELRPRKLFLVDMWRLQSEGYEWGGPYTNNGRLTTEQAMLDAKNRMVPFERQTEVVILETFSQTFIANFSSYSVEKLDFVYLDTSHDYKLTLEELDLIAPLIADDGVILGDDWYPDVTHYDHGVMRAVNEWLKRNDGWQLVVAGQNAQFCLRRTPRYPQDHTKQG
jgi:hypothetical protein